MTAVMLAAALLAGCSGGETPVPPSNSNGSADSNASSSAPEPPSGSSSSSTSSSSSSTASSSDTQEPEEPSDGIEWTYKDNGNGTATLTGYNKSGKKVPSGAVTIPCKVGEKKLTVTAIGNSCFYQDNNITGVVIPDTVKSIGTRAFYACKNLSEVTFPEGLQTIGEYAFASDALIEVVVPKSVTRMGNDVFDSNTALQTATILGNVSFGNGAFYKCSSLQNVQIMGNVSDIPVKYKTADGIWLSRWVYNQKRLLQSRSEKLSEEQKKKLKELLGYYVKISA